MSANIFLTFIALTPYIRRLIFILQITAIINLIKRITQLTAAVFVAAILSPHSACSTPPPRNWAVYPERRDYLFQRQHCRKVEGEARTPLDWSQH